ncbi:ABC transporter permease [Oceanispirochaeta sp.]|jgi:putative spermidine/putrescine transport system permease protein|uniref:ABC transporter permease n=1 Tax=Oceanispirochaeta sp. TaxID=2035350 RepID=UPI002632C897|nr:ABC transporter permease subunit [Oceanispirochaeta sp.]MDA3955471.1 ABC transporter permease subunit [Oceanispirochaeta sp.]
MLTTSSRGYILLAPALIILIFLFFGGFILGTLQSLNYFPLIGLDSPSLDAYEKVLHNEELLPGIILTFFVSFTATVLTVVLGVMTALALRGRFRGRKGLLFFYQFPVTVPHIIIALGTVLFLSQSGTLSRFVYLLGGIRDSSEFPALVNDRWGWGIILVYLWKQIPFIGIIVLSVLQSLGDDYEELAVSLGARRFQVFRHVLIPLILPGVLPGSIICFAYTFGSYEVPYLLGRPYPSMLSVLVYRYFSNPDLGQRSPAMALSILMTVFLLIFVLVYKGLINRVGSHE